jgi:hypothetical protein
MIYNIVMNLELTQGMQALLAVCVVLLLVLLYCVSMRRSSMASNPAIGAAIGNAANRNFYLERSLFTPKSEPPVFWNIGNVNDTVKYQSSSSSSELTARKIAVMNRLNNNTYSGSAEQVSQARLRDQEEARNLGLVQTSNGMWTYGSGFIDRDGGITGGELTEEQLQRAIRS